jgi:hypothetical protein
MNSNYLSLKETCHGCERRVVPSMKVQLVPETFSMGYQSLTHGVESNNNYQNFTNAYFLNRVPESGYKFEKRVCNGDKLYPIQTNNVQISKSVHQPEMSEQSVAHGIPLNNMNMSKMTADCDAYKHTGLQYCDASQCCEGGNNVSRK